MQKYSFLVYHKEYPDFLRNIQGLGVLHIIENKVDFNNDMLSKQVLLKEYEQVIKLLKKRENQIASNSGDPLETLDGKIFDYITQKQDELERTQQKLTNTQKNLVKAEPWGDFSPETIKLLKENDYNLKFFISPKRKFEPRWLTEYHSEIINQIGNQVWFIVVQHGSEELNIKAEEVDQPETLSKLEKQISDYEDEVILLNKSIDRYVHSGIQSLEREIMELTADLEYDKVFLNTSSAVEEKIKMLQGWIPKTLKKKLDDYLEKNDILHIIEKVSEEDNAPILLKNNRFSRLFEPIGKLFSMPSYTELDLTVFFAPFFMMFFGFCLGDAGYGLLFVLGAGIYKYKSKKELKPLLSLVQILGVATIVFGIISGTFFGVNLIETEVHFFNNLKKMFLNPDQMFNLALILGAVQIVFALFIKALNQIKQYGFTHSLATIGWLIIILGSGLFLLLAKEGIISNSKLALYIIMSTGGFMILFFSDLNISIPARIGKGIWDIYSTVTGIFGDLLSYIRLFALGLSSAILGFVINDIAMQILSASKIIGPIVFVIFLILGHGLNIMISSLGSFVHPMRLTFVEFYKNAGFEGGGREYKPFSD